MTAKPTFKQCACGRGYTRAEWDALALCGHIEFDGSSLIELRHCAACDSSIAVAARWSKARDRMVSLIDG